MNEPVCVACVQAEPVILDRERTLEKLAALTAEARAAGAGLVVFPETFLPAYPSSAWAKYLAGWADPRAKGSFAMLARESVEVPGPAADRLGEIARDNEVWLVTGVNERDPGNPGTLYNACERIWCLEHRRSTTPSSTTRPRASSLSTTASWCRPTTSG